MWIIRTVGILGTVLTLTVTHVLASDSAWVYTAAVEPAWFDYEEDSNTVKSDWDAYGFRFRMGLEGYDQQALEGGIRLGLTTTFDERESWNQSGSLRQMNDLSLLGVDVLTEVGWAFHPLQDRLTFTPVVGYGYRHIRFKREDFNITTAITARTVADEEYDIQYADAGARVHFKWTEHLTLQGRLSYGAVFDSVQSNSATDEIEADDGYIVKAEAGLTYVFSQRFAASLGGFADLQHLDEKIQNGNTWPDNDLTIYGMTLEGSYLF